MILRHGLYGSRALRDASMIKLYETASISYSQNLVATCAQVGGFLGIGRGVGAGR